ncbi:NAD-dependent succinate-semialdehyde dehydrogenase [Tunturiibacter gelidoferens]|uniref:Succinate-semialdehyde dehydrogenase/glutarate-semialdehyde dehydrogenase n=1 Tax=Tunturiibacter gelidiferens TaxID=3069689 RepID=A0ACC5P3Z9_9BACT|nr:NAD-dependent succinate-semialdehyde dehydrogenase [Edaphobacter lichenicola]MBB5341579.1 succinate-semialdehyde dehydrogenase/glutarate-semialdehyde dehydrogenase [Edaphobacter lichenicola]
MGIASINPATGEVMKTYDPLTDKELATKLDKAAAAFVLHRETSFAYRAERMIKAAEILEDEKDQFGRLMSLEMGKPIQAAIDEAVKSAWACRYYAEHAERFLADEAVETSANRSYIRYQPLGPVLAIMPWNYPFWQVIRFVAPALMAGNVGLLKHASNVPQSALAVEDVFLRAGFAEGVFQTLLVGASKVEGILADPRIAAATLTGSEGAGVQVGISAAKSIKKVVLELGGSDPFIVMKSANFAEAVATAVKARVANNGQSCIAAKRFIVEDSIADRFEKEFVARMEALKVGDPLDRTTELGPLASTSAVEDLHRDVQKSVDAGARLLTGGKPIPGKGSFYPPTVLTDIPRDSPAYSEEFFGPVATIFRVKDAEEAIRIANDTRFGLGASVWTQDESERDHLIQELEAGMVFVNKMVASDPRVPFGGVKRSGFGRELGPFGIREFTNVKTVWIEK